MPRHRPLSAFVITRPRGLAAPVVFDSPHSGFTFPQDFLPAASLAELRATWDAYVDELCQGVAAAGATLVAATFPRCYIDANRAIDDIDPEMLSAPWPEPVVLSEHARRGLGLIRRDARPGVRMYRRRLDPAEVQARITRCYQPYRSALADEIEAAFATHGAVWHFNMHSMKSRGRANRRDGGVPRADFVIGDRDATSAPRELTAWVAGIFIRRGYQVRINTPYRGADIVRTHGDPRHGRYSIQIEINRALYMDEARCARGPGFVRVQEDITALAQAVADRVRDSRHAAPET